MSNIEVMYPLALGADDTLMNVVVAKEKIHVLIFLDYVVSHCTQIGWCRSDVPSDDKSGALFIVVYCMIKHFLEEG